MYNILALDQASRTSRFAIFRDGYLYTYGTFTFVDSDIGIRLNKIKQKVLELIEDYDIDEIVLEDIYMDGQKINNAKTFKILAEVFGVLSETCVDIKLPYSAVVSSSWKSTCGIKGRTRAEQKKNAQQFVLDKYQVKAKEDACDAICIGTHIITKSQEEINWD